MKQKRPHLNLASSPVRNRRLFYSLSGLLAAGFMALSISGGLMYIRYSLKSQDLQDSLAEMDERIRGFKREETRFSKQIENLSRDNKEDVNLLNGIIYQKTFSWEDLLTRFEKALPDGCYLVSLRPQVQGDLNLNLRIEFASPDMKGLLDLVNRMRSMGFSNIRLINETRGDRGRTHYELVVRYERAG